MTVKDILKLLKDDNQKISLRVDNWFKFVSIKSNFPEEYLEREVISIIPFINYKSIEDGSFVIDIKGKFNNKNYGGNKYDK